MTTPTLPGPVPDLAAGRVFRALLVAYLAATAIHIGFIVVHEPFTFDAWNVAIDTHVQPPSLAGMYDYLRYQYAHENPRIGQWFMYLGYKFEWFAPIATPVAFLALSLAITVLGLGRWPWRRGRDLALWAIALGTSWFVLPQIGGIMFCRAYGTNYLYSAAIQLWFVIALRFAPEARAGWLGTLAYGVFGIIAGMGNEHTGPTLVLFALGLAVLRQHRTGRPPRLAWAAAIGAMAGFAAIFLAPGQGERYEGMAAKVSLVARLLQRGITSNLDLFRGFVIGCAPVLAMIAVALILGARDAAPADAVALRRRAALRLLGQVAIAGTLVTATVFVSPKIGPRFYLISCALVLAAFLAILDSVATPRRIAPFVVLAVAASIYAGVRTVPLFVRLGQESADRLALLGSAPHGAMVTVESLDQVDDSWWFLGDDLRKPKQRDMVAAYFGLGGLVFRAVEPDAPLGVSDVRLVPRYRITPASCLDEHGGFELTGFRGLDVGTIQRAMLDEVARTRTRLGSAGRLDRLDLAVELIGAPPALPRKTLLIGRWWPDRFEGWAGSIERRGVGRARSIILPSGLRGSDLEIFIYHLGGPLGGVARRLGTARDAALEYIPWSRGGYWALACNADECFVIAATRLL